MSDLINLVNQYRSELLNNDLEAENKLARAYHASYKSLLGSIDQLTEITSGEKYTRSQVYKLTRYKSLLAQVAGELAKLQQLTIAEVESASKFGIKLGDDHARGLIAASIQDEALQVAFNRLNPENVKSLLGFLDPKGELYNRMNEISSVGADRIGADLLDGIVRGYNPNKIAQMFTAAWGMGLSDAIRMVRTAQLYSYREASRANYIANSDVVEGWIWCAKLDLKTCVACISLHGSYHTNDETLNDHYCGRCAPVPVVKGMPRPIKEGDGERWFNSISKEDQIKMMGKGKFTAWKKGKFEFGDLSKIIDDPVYGDMRVEASLKHLLQNEGKKGVTTGQVARKLVAEATDFETRLSPMIKDLASKHGAELKGYEFRVKSVESTVTELRRAVRDNHVTIEGAAKYVEDLNRYTFAFHPDQLVSKATEVFEDLRSRGYTPYNCKSRFGKANSTYQGYNTMWKNSKGEYFELQFHTPESFQIKMDNHVWYDRTLVSTNAAEIAELNRLMARAWDNFIPPNNYLQLNDLETKQFISDLQKVLNEKESISSYYRKSKEYGYVYDDHGNILLEKEGRRHAIDFTGSECAMMSRNRNATLLHNHPSDSMSCLSTGDIRFASTVGLKEIRATSKFGTSVMTRGVKGWNYSSRAMTEAELLAKDAALNTPEYIDAQDILNRTLEEFANLTGNRYEFIPRPPFKGWRL